MWFLCIHFVVTAGPVNQLKTPCLKILDKSLVFKGEWPGRPREQGLGFVPSGPISGGADFLVRIDRSHLLISDSSLELGIWRYTGTTTLAQKSALRLTHCYGTCDYSPTIKAIAVSNSNAINNQILIYSIDKAYRFIKKNTINLERQFARGPTMEIRFSPEGSIVAYASYMEKRIVVLETRTYNQLRLLAYPKHVDRMVFLKEDSFMSIADDGEIVLWDLSKKTNCAIRTFTIPRTNSDIGGCRLDRDRKELLIYYTRLGNTIGISTISFKGNICVKHRVLLLKGYDGGFFKSQISPNGEYLVFSNLNSEVRAVNLRTGMLSRPVFTKRVAGGFCFVRDSGGFVCGCCGGYCYLMSLKR